MGILNGDFNGILNGDFKWVFYIGEFKRGF